MVVLFASPWLNSRTGTVQRSPRRSIRETAFTPPASASFGSFRGENAGFGEYMYVLRGEGTVTSADGASLELRAGVSFVARPGWCGSWHVRESILKIYVIWRTPTLTGELEELP